MNAILAGPCFLCSKNRSFERLTELLAQGRWCTACEWDMSARRAEREKVRDMAIAEQERADAQLAADGRLADAGIRADEAHESGCPAHCKTEELRADRDRKCAEMARERR